MKKYSGYLELTHKGRLVTSGKIEQIADENDDVVEKWGTGYKVKSWKVMEKLSEAHAEAKKEQSIPDFISTGGASDPQFDFFDDEE